MSGPTPASPLTTAGSIVGTIQYMSPEQIEGKEADARSDLFAFGAVLYEMATGKRAFEGKSQISVASAILETIALAKAKDSHFLCGLEVVTSSARGVHNRGPQPRENTPPGGCRPVVDRLWTP